MFAYIGAGPGQELIPYFFALLAFILTSILAVFQYPFLVLWRMIRPKSPAQVSNQEAFAASASHAQREAAPAYSASAAESPTTTQAR